MDCRAEKGHGWGTRATGQ